MANVESMIVEEKPQLKQIDREKVSLIRTSIGLYFYCLFYWLFRLVHYYCVYSALLAGIILYPNICTIMFPQMNYKFTLGWMHHYTSLRRLCVM